MGDFAAILMIFSIYSTQCVVGKTTYIITAPTLTRSFCPGEFSGEPCLTLQQYATFSNQISDSTTLILESGTHRLHESAFFNPHNFENFTMIAESAEIIIASIFQIQSHYNSLAHYVHISGITFTGSGYEYVTLKYIQEVMIENCRFQGVSLRLSTIGNAMITTTCFFNSSYYRGAISSDYSCNSDDY